MTVKQNLTVGIGVESINSLISSFKDNQELSAELLANATSVISVDLSARDYLMGLPLEMGIADCIRFAETIIPLVGEKHTAPWYSVLSAYHYENGDTPNAYLALEKALSLVNGYPLALLLKRVYTAGWPPASFVAMRDQLHPKVKAELTERADKVISPIE